MLLWLALPVAHCANVIAFSYSLLTGLLPEEHEYKFWSTQPVPKLHENPTEHGPIETKTVEEVMKDPYPLPSQFYWDSIDMKNEEQAAEVYTLLSQNYVEDDDNMFRFDYSKEFLKW